MGTAGRSHKVNLVAGLISNDLSTLERSRAALVRLFGAIDLMSPVTDFTHTDYYDREMGQGLKRQYLSFMKPVSCHRIWRAKARTNDLEKRFSKGGRRTVNIDPGYIDLSKLVLLSTKDYTHRIYMADGIFAEVTLYYKDKSFRAWPWTYPDYKDADTIGFFNGVRESYRAKKT